MNKKGFTLIELLAVIVILAVIALIATASIIQIIDRAEKGALEDSAYGIIEAGKVFYIDHILPGTNQENGERFNFEVIEKKFVNVKNKEEKLEFKGSMPKSGKLQIHANGDTAIAICNNKYCACKSIAETRVTVQKEDCEIDEDTGEIGKKKDTTPVGVVVSYMGNNPPEGYLSCDGATYNISEYPKLAEQIKTEFGSYNHFGGNGTTTFAVPDLRGEFLRGTGTANRNTGAGASVGIHQNPTQFPYIRGSSSIVWTDKGDISFPDTLNKQTGGTNKVSAEGNNFRRESDYYSSRPTNTSVLYCIKY